MNTSLMMQDNETGRTLDLSHLLPSLERQGIEPGDVAQVDCEPVQGGIVLYVWDHAGRCAILAVDGDGLTQLFAPVVVH